MTYFLYPNGGRRNGGRSNDDIVLRNEPVFSGSKSECEAEYDLRTSDFDYKDFEWTDYIVLSEEAVEAAENSSHYTSVVADWNR